MRTFPTEKAKSTLTVPASHLQKVTTALAPPREANQILNLTKIKSVSFQIDFFLPLLLSQDWRKRRRKKEKRKREEITSYI